MQVHGALVQVLGVGVLIRGPSGIGKSETALELVTRGHRLVADDVVQIERGDRGALVGSAPALIRHHLEIRGIGILDIPDLFGPGSVLEEGRIELVCRLEQWKAGEEYERVGLTRPLETLDGAELPSVLLPVRPSANMATLIEVAVRDHQRRPAAGSAAERIDARMRADGAGS